MIYDLDASFRWHDTLIYTTNASLRWHDTPNVFWIS